MRELHRWVNRLVSTLVFTLISSVAFYVNGTERRFDFEIHKEHFIEGEYSTSIKNHRFTQTIEITFKDGCAVKYDADLQTGRPRNWRWSKREIHGKLM